MAEEADSLGDEARLELLGYIGRGVADVRCMDMAVTPREGVALHEHCVKSSRAGEARLRAGSAEGEQGEGKKGESVKERLLF